MNKQNKIISVLFLISAIYGQTAGPQQQQNTVVCEDVSYHPKFGCEGLVTMLPCDEILNEIQDNGVPYCAVTCGYCQEGTDIVIDSTDSQTPLPTLDRDVQNVQNQIPTTAIQEPEPELQQQQQQVGQQQQPQASLDVKNDRIASSVADTLEPEPEEEEAQQTQADGDENNDDVLDLPTLSPSFSKNLGKQPSKQISEEPEVEPLIQKGVIASPQLPRTLPQIPVMSRQPILAQEPQVEVDETPAQDLPAVVPTSIPMVVPSPELLTEVPPIVPTATPSRQVPQRPPSGVQQPSLPPAVQDLPIPWGPNAAPSGYLNPFVPANAQTNQQAAPGGLPSAQTPQELPSPSGQAQVASTRTDSSCLSLNQCACLPTWSLLGTTYQGCSNLLGGNYCKIDESSCSTQVEGALGLISLAQYGEDGFVDICNPSCVGDTASDPRPVPPTQTTTPNLTASPSAAVGTPNATNVNSTQIAPGMSSNSSVPNVPQRYLNYQVNSTRSNNTSLQCPTLNNCSCISTPYRFQGDTYTGCSALGQSQNVYCRVNITTCLGSQDGLIPLSAYGEEGFGDVCDHRCGFKGGYDDYYGYGDYYGYDYSSPPLDAYGNNMLDTMLQGLFVDYLTPYLQNYPQYAGLLGTPSGQTTNPLLFGN